MRRPEPRTAASTGDRREVAELLRQLALLVDGRELLRRGGAGEQELEAIGARIARLHWRLAGAARTSAAPDGLEAA